MKEFNKSIDLAYALYEKDYEVRCQVFSFGWFKGRIVAIGRNRLKTHTLNLRNPIRDLNNRIINEKSTCAELNLFIKLRNKTNIPFNKISIYNVRLDRNLQVKNSRPCLSCDSLISFLSPREIYFTNDSGNFERYVSTN